MSIVSKAQLKNDFLTDKIITEPKMEDLIDSCYNVGGGSYTLAKATLSLSTAELINLSLTSDPKIIIPAQGPNTIVVPTVLIATVTGTAIPLVGGNDLGLFQGLDILTHAQILFVGNILSSSVDRTIGTEGMGFGLPTNLKQLEPNMPTYLTTGASDATDPGGSAFTTNVIVMYYVIEI